jgi:hypothetical protein
LSLSWARSIHSTLPHPISPRSIYLCLGLHSGLSSFIWLSPAITYTRSSSPHSCYMPRPSHPPRRCWRRARFPLLLSLLAAMSSARIRRWSMHQSRVLKLLRK